MVRPPATDGGILPNMKWSFADSHTRIEDGGWARETTIRELPTSKELAGVNMRLEEGAIRELHWHKEVRRSSKSHAYRERLPKKPQFPFGFYPQKLCMGVYYPRTVTVTSFWLISTKPCIEGRLPMTRSFGLVELFKSMWKRRDGSFGIVTFSDNLPLMIWYLVYAYLLLHSLTAMLPKKILPPDYLLTLLCVSGRMGICPRGPRPSHSTRH